MNITARATRSGNWWAIEFTGPAGTRHTQAKRLDQVEDMVRDICDMDGISNDDITVTVEPRTDRDSTISHARELRESADRAADEASRAVREAAKGLVSDGLTVRDAGRLLGVSPQRVSQLVS